MAGWVAAVQLAAGGLTWLGGLKVSLPVNRLPVSLQVLEIRVLGGHMAGEIGRV